jgi:hypothetical protein
MATKRPLVEVMQVRACACACDALRLRLSRAPLGRGVHPPSSILHLCVSQHHPRAFAAHAW